MSTFAVLASGPSMSQAVADSVRGRCRVIAVSDSYRLAPWADALVSQDRSWWRVHAEGAMKFEGRKFTGSDFPDVEKVQFEGGITTGSNSGLLAMWVAIKVFEAKRLLLLGFDMGGSHFFGPHPEPLKNTQPRRFDAFQEQFARFKPRGVEIWNCTPGSHLKAYKKGNLEDCLAQSTASAV